ncbi:phage holin [Lactiplantibacillus plantarum]|uniref:phage holin n=1 Tax=Lactiplantibacillus plantarum TaxID=1590 RepID=UPI00374EF099
MACKNSFLLRDDLFIIRSLKSCLRNQLTSNQGLSLTGHNLLPITSDQVNDWVSLTFTIVTALIAYFDNDTIIKDSKVNGGNQGETQK